MIPGEYQLAEGDIIANVGRKTVTIEVTNSGDRPIQVGSHYHFFETNNALKFDRTLARGMRLNVPSGNAVRFEPGEEKEVQLTAIGGTKRVFGLNDLTCAQISEVNKEAALNNARTKGFMPKA